jgi:hypothetical protein
MRRPGLNNRQSDPVNLLVVWQYKIQMIEISYSIFKNMYHFCTLTGYFGAFAKPQCYAIRPQDSYIAVNQ